MSEKMSEVYEAYDIEIRQTARGRGAFLVTSDSGLYQLKTPDVNESRLMAEYQFKEKLRDMGFRNIDRCIKNKRDELVTYDRYNNPYVMRAFFEGRECNLNSAEEVELAVRNLASLHTVCRRILNVTDGDVHIRVCNDFKKRNQELRRVRKFMARQKKHRDFEDVYVGAYNYFYEQARECERLLGESENGASTEVNTPHLGYCHGMYNQHSVLISQADKKPRVAGTINFDRFYVGNQLNDLYHFMRKTLEKNNYNFAFAGKIIEAYDRVCPLSRDDIRYICIQYGYPEKFYKISNQYFNSSKNWISPKMLEKLNKLIADEDKKQAVLQKLKSL